MRSRINQKRFRLFIVIQMLSVFAVCVCGDTLLLSDDFSTNGTTRVILWEVRGTEVQTGGVDWEAPADWRNMQFRSIDGEMVAANSKFGGAHIEAPLDYDTVAEPTVRITVDVKFEPDEFVTDYRAGAYVYFGDDFSGVPWQSGATNGLRMKLVPVGSNQGLIQVRKADGNSTMSGVGNLYVTDFNEDHVYTMMMEYTADTGLLTYSVVDTVTGAEYGQSVTLIEADRPDSAGMDRVGLYFGILDTTDEWTNETPVNWYDNFSVSGIAAPLPDDLGNLSLASAGNGMSFSWDGSSSYSYALQTCTNLVSGAWIDAVTNIAGADGTVSVTSGVSAVNSFYRLRLEE